MPNILRNFRVDPVLWENAKSKAADDDVSLTSVLTDALAAYLGGDLLPLTAAATGPTAAILGYGSLSDSEDPATQAAVQRVRELFADGAVGVSVGADMDPASMPDKEVLDDLLAKEKFDEIEKLLADVPMRIRHVAVVDTAAFSDARLTLSEDGSVTGPVTFEGIWTGDMRFFPVNSFTWENVLPVPMIWDRQDGDHTGTVVGMFHSFERVEGERSSARPASVEQDALVASAGGVLKYPAAYFAEQNLRAQTPLTITQPDANGLRHIFGHVAPHGVCHRSDMAPCFTYPGDVFSDHRQFHTGAVVDLSDGTSVRVGAITLGGGHINPRLAREGVTASEVNAHRDNANTVFAMVRAYDDPYGLAVSGVVMPDIPPAQIMRAQSCAPSVELWPANGGRTLVGAHLVPTPAWPVAASLGSSVELSAGDSVVVQEPEPEPEPEPVDDPVLASLQRLESAIALLVANSVD